MTAAFPRLRLRNPTQELLELPWELPLEEWPEDGLPFRTLPVGPSRHVVRFLVTDLGLIALKEEPLWIAEREYDVLRHLEEAGLPAVGPLGLAEAPDREAAILVTTYLKSSLQYRLLLSRVPPGPGYLRDQLLDAMAGLLVELHGGGLYWGDCSLANTLFRRDGDKIQAYLVDAETSELHPSLSDGQRAYDLDVLVENVAFGLADLAAMQGRDDLFDESLAAAESVRDRYRALWDELHAEIEVGGRRTLRHGGQGAAPQRPRLRRRRDAARARARRPRPAASRGDQSPLPCPRAGAPDRPPGPRGPGPPPSQRPPRVRRVARAGRAADPRRRRTKPSAGWPMSSSRPWTGSTRSSAPMATPSRPTATSSRRSGCCPSARSAMLGSTAAIDAYLATGAPGPEISGAIGETG